LPLLRSVPTRPTAPSHAVPAPIHARSVSAWPTAFWQVPRPETTQFPHLGGPVTCTGDPVCGSRALWVEAEGEQAAGLACDSIEVSKGVVAMADPLAVITSVRLL
jgi:hypothetical protein